MNDEVKSDKRRFFVDLSKVEIVRNGKRMRWDDKTNSFIDIIITDKEEKLKEFKK